MSTLLLPAPPDTPSKPLVTDVTSENVTISWQPPYDDGGAPVTSYLVEKRERGSAFWSKVSASPADETTMTVTRLRNGSEYEFRISAENTAGLSRPSEPSGFVKVQEASGMVKLVALRARCED